MNTDTITEINSLLKKGQAENALELVLQNFGEKHQYTAIALDSVASKYYQSQNFNLAIVAIEKSLKIWEEINGPECLEVAACYNNLGRICEHLEQFDHAVSYHKRALELRKTLLGNHPETAMSLLSLGTAHMCNDEISFARTRFSEGVALNNILNTADSANAMACKENLKICEEVLKNKKCSCSGQ